MSDEMDAVEQITEAAARDAEASAEVVEEIRDGDAVGAVGDGIEGAGAAAGPMLRAVGVDSDDAAAVVSLTESVSHAVERTREAADAYRAATSDGARHLAAAEAGAAVAGGAVGGGRAIAALAGADGTVLGAFSAAEHVVEMIPALARSVRSVTEMVARGQRARRAVNYAIRFEGEPDSWQLREVELREAINRPYHGRLLVSTEEMDACPGRMLGRNVRVSMTRGGRVRLIHGIVSRIEHGDRSAEALVCTVEIVPALAALAHGRDQRIFQGVTVPQLLETFLSEHLAPYGREAEVVSSRDREPRDIVVQWEESPLDFAHRLMEEEGLSYYFEQPADGPERLVIVDENEHFPAAESEGEHVPFVARVANDFEGAEPVTELRWAEQIGVTDVVVRDWDWTKAEPPDCADATVHAEDRSDPAAEPVLRESFEVGGGIHHHRYDPSRLSFDLNDATIQATLRAEAHRMGRRTARGRGITTTFSPGRVFELLGHPVSAFDREYLVIETVHRGRNPRFAERAAEGASGSPLEHECEFVCIPSDVPHRPSRTTAKPRVHGIRSAVVVGPRNEEIHCDEQGRVRIRFEWDRLDVAPEQRTCWVRCMQSWAGVGFGTFFLPRVGMEVLVSFIDGDPDRPVVTGAVYGGHRHAPYELPANKTRSTIRTQSSPNDGGYNEIRFEDQRDGEQIFVHAERDLDEEVEHDHTTHVRNCQRNTVDVDQTEKVHRDQRLTVDRDRFKKVGEDEDIEIGSNRRAHIGVDETTIIDGREYHRVDLERTIRVGGPETESFDGGRHCTVKRHDVLHVADGANRTVHVEGQYNIQADQRFRASQANALVLLEGNRTYIAAPNSITLNAGASPGAGPAASHVRLEPDGTVVVAANTRIVMQVGESRLVIDANDIRLEAPREVAMAASSSSFVRVTSAAAEVRSANVDVVAEQIAYVGGMLVKLN